eukprot:TRINITY_DN837_c0_g1_i31.p1 TRINITY_DN837_c0_g1~~TRINITY_DN837_c0_g1_i31.p1  ORF type:complete len:275 (+),score=-19.36 TRINITY_DN837_c0_g1_i31:406-1230(+)
MRRRRLRRRSRRRRSRRRDLAGRRHPRAVAHARRGRRPGHRTRRLRQRPWRVRPRYLCLALFSCATTSYPVDPLSLSTPTKTHDKPPFSTALIPQAALLHTKRYPRMRCTLGCSGSVRRCTRSIARAHPRSACSSHHRSRVVPRLPTLTSTVTWQTPCWRLSTSMSRGGWPPAATFAAGTRPSGWPGPPCARALSAPFPAATRAAGPGLSSLTMTGPSLASGMALGSSASPDAAATPAGGSVREGEGEGEGQGKGQGRHRYHHCRHSHAPHVQR